MIGLQGFVRMPMRWLVFMAVLLAGWLAAPAVQAGTVLWGTARTAVYDPTYCCTLRDDAPISAATGGFDLVAGALTSDASRADIVINAYGTLGAVGVLALNESFDATSTNDPASGYATRITLRAGGVYLVVMADGRRAKLRIDTITSGKVYFSWRLQASAPPQPRNVTYLTVCMRQDPPAGMLCAAPQPLDQLMTTSQTDALLRAGLGCTSLNAGAYWCGPGSTIDPGHMLVYSTRDSKVLEVVYVIFN